MTDARRRLRELGHAPGRFPAGPRSALVDVPGTRVGHVTIERDGPAVARTGVTAVLPHGGNLYERKVLGACHVVNGYGKATGLAQLAELGTVETPVLVTGTLSVGPAWEGCLLHLLDENPDAARDRDTINPIVLDVFDGWLSDARGLHVRPEHAREAIATASEDDARAGALGAGTGTMCLGFKSGVGNASRTTLAEPVHVLGCLAVTNYGSRRDLGVLVGREPDGPDAPAEPGAGGSVVVVIATDAPLSERQLGRLAARGALGLARAGSYARNQSGDFVLAFSTAQLVPHRAAEPHNELRLLRDDSLHMRELFETAAEATREAVLDSLCAAGPTEGRDGRRAAALPYELLERMLRT